MHIFLWSVMVQSYEHSMTSEPGISQPCIRKPINLGRCIDCFLPFNFRRQGWSCIDMNRRALKCQGFCFFLNHFDMLLGCKFQAYCLCRGCLVTIQRSAVCLQSPDALRDKALVASPAVFLPPACCMVYLMSCLFQQTQCVYMRGGSWCPQWAEESIEY